MVKFNRQFFSSYKLAVMISTCSLGLGIVREFLILGLLGFSAHNDILQLYLSVYYTIGLTIDAVRLSCLNLYAQLSLTRMLIVASIVALPFATVVGLLMSLASGGLQPLLLTVTILGSYLNLIAALLITYKQRSDVFLAAQIINALPNFILIPGVLFCYFLNANNPAPAIVWFTSLIPIVQCLLLLALPNRSEPQFTNPPATFMKSLIVFTRHFAAMISDQGYQIITRSAFYHFGTGYLSLFAFTIRIYSAARFILVDSLIGSKLASWQDKVNTENYYFTKVVSSTFFSLSLAVAIFIFSLQTFDNFFLAAVQMGVLLSAGFYFSTLVRVMYFKINQHETNPQLVLRFAFCEFVCMLCALTLTAISNYPIITLLWLGYIAKPFSQLLLLRRKYHELVAWQGASS